MLAAWEEVWFKEVVWEEIASLISCVSTLPRIAQLKNWWWKRLQFDHLKGFDALMRWFSDGATQKFIRKSYTKDNFRIYTWRTGSLNQFNSSSNGTYILSKLMKAKNETILESNQTLPSKSNGNSQWKIISDHLFQWKHLQIPIVPG